ncbi:uncharacterized protein NFIA_113160 [Aspergillus fischeri NRRL 181]|uniref:Uncharacterized protein n=1 Tax=Neosartorya fischeri (strain ATCC 1020 / DSM 3700 / CBS 544.65 / FGSC A1164 / JCM 1740 / NRRL 181 / WB 181) TaxID=331117 RepID=A1D8S5_NEOFI|nr:conserved hypothetical protein [Aspergillus fischeri NRRL 181]EAW20786.1 conserved hypothetical protein [Aspergillus fischeri NRRL 181]
MSSPGPNSSLSLSTRLLCYLGPPSALLLIGTTSPKAALLSPLSLIPTAVFCKKWKKRSNASPTRHAGIEPLIWTFTLSGTLGLAAAAVVQMGICQAVGAVLFSSEDLRTEFWTEFGRTTVAGLTQEQLLRRAELASSWQNWVFNGALTYVAAGLVEELLKYIPVMYARRRDAKKKQRRDRAYIDYVLASALGFSVVENIGFIYSACVGGQESWPKLLLTFMERVVVGQLGHLSVACLTALRATRRDYHGDSLGLWGVIGPAALFHGTYNFALMSVSAMEGNVGWIHPNGLRNTVLALGLVSGMIGLAVRKVKQEWRKVQKYEQDRLKDDESRK